MKSINNIIEKSTSLALFRICENAGRSNLLQIMPGCLSAHTTPEVSQKSHYRHPQLSACVIQSNVNMLTLFLLSRTLLFPKGNLRANSSTRPFPKVSGMQRG